MPPQGFRESDTEHAPLTITDDDRRRADLIGQAVQRLDMVKVRVLEEYWGAYPNAGVERADRMKKLNMSGHNAKRLRQQAEQYVEGFVEARLTG